MKSISQLFFVIFLVILVGCSSDDANNPVGNNSQNDSILPLKVGNSWTYTTTDPGGTDDRTNTITGTQNISGNSVFTFNDDWLFDNDAGYENEGILYGMKISNPTTSTEVVFPKNPSINQTWMVDEKTWTLVSTNESVTVPAGTFSCYKIDANHNNKQFFVWFAKGVGIVKLEGGESSSVLKNYLIN